MTCHLQRVQVLWLSLPFFSSWKSLFVWRSLDCAESIKSTVANPRRVWGIDLGTRPSDGLESGIVYLTCAGPWCAEYDVALRTGPEIGGRDTTVIPMASQTLKKKKKVLELASYLSTYLDFLIHSCVNPVNIYFNENNVIIYVYNITQTNWLNNIQKYVSQNKGYVIGKRPNSNTLWQ